MISDRSWVQVLVDCPGAQGLYTYEIPADLVVQVGDILSVPFAAQQVGAIALVLDSDEKSIRQLVLDSAKIRKIDAVVSSGFFPDHYWTLLHRVAQYYQTPLMQVVRAALPPGLLSRSQRRLKLCSDRDNNLTNKRTVTAQAQQVLDLLIESKTGDYSWRFVQQKVKGLGKVVQELVRSGLVESYLQPPQTVRPKQQQAVILVSDISVDLDNQLSDRHREILECLKRLGGEAWVSPIPQYGSLDEAPHEIAVQQTHFSPTF